MNMQIHSLPVDGAYRTAEFSLVNAVQQFTDFLFFMSLFIAMQFVHKSGTEIGQNKTKKWFQFMARRPEHL